MTREEAITVLKNEQPHCGKKASFPEEKKYEAYNRAIKALEQEPTYYPPCMDCNKKMNEIRHAYDKLKEQEPCEDAISRAWLKEAIHNFYYGLKHTPTEEDIQAYIDAALSVTLKQRTGHWIEDEYEMEVRCSVCGEENDECSKYCPNCGATMKENSSDGI